MRNTSRRPLARPRRPNIQSKTQTRRARQPAPPDPADPRALVEFIAKSLVDMPDQVSVTQRSDRASVELRLKVAAEETGRVIGREGRLATAMRALLKVIGARARKRIKLDIGD